MVNLSKPLVAGQTPPAFLQKLAPGSPEDSSYHPEFIQLSGSSLGQEDAQ